MLKLQIIKIKKGRILPLILLFLSSLLTLQGQQFSPTTFNGQNITKHKLPAFIKQQESHYANLKIGEHKTADFIHTLISLSQLHRINLNYSTAFDRAGEALFLAEENGNALLLAETHQEYGLLNYLFKQDKAADDHLSLSLTYAKQAYQEGLLEHQNLYPYYYYRLLYFQRAENIEMMTLYIDSCQGFIDQYKWGLDKQIYIKEKTAFLRFQQDKEDETLQLLKETESLINTNESLKAHQPFLIVILGVLADHYRRVGNTEEAISYYNKALEIADNYGEHTFYIEYLHSNCAHEIFRKGDAKGAYQHMLQAKRINDSFLNPRKDALQDFLSIKNRYREELNLRNESLQQQTIEIAEQKTQLWKIRVLFFIIIFLFTVALLLVLRKRQKQQQTLEISVYKERRRHNEALIENKNKELTSSMLQLIEKEEIIKTLSDTLKEEVPGSKTKSLLKSIAQQSTNLWEDFNKRFMEQNSDFYDRLKEKAPNLSSADLKICALIKLNFSGKEMAHLLGISEGSVHVARHRLRKKMELGRDINLTQFINAI